MMFWIIASIFFCVFLSNMIHIIICGRWLTTEKSRYKHKNSYDTNTKPLFLLIPVLNEQKIIKDTYLYFKDLLRDYENVFMVFVSTEKENSSQKKTSEILEELISKNKDEKKIWLINYPYKKGVMAHQLNYAIRILSEKLDTEDFWIGVYNADSRINRSTIDFVLKTINEVGNCKHICMQQYSWYYTSKGNRSGLMSSAALWQTRWSVTFEMARVCIQLFFNKMRLSKLLSIFLEKMNYIIGHGFFINVAVLKSLGGFPENSINEDAFLGYMLNCAHIQIKPIPFFERAESPNRLKIYLKQQDTWFNGPCYAFEYYKMLSCKQEHFVFRNFLLAFKLFLHAVYWVLAPVMLLVLCPMTIKNSLEVFVYVLLVLLHLPFTHMLIRKFIHAHIDEEDNASLPKASLWCVLLYLVHCVGPINNIIKQIRGVNTIDNKYKTER